jgi:hypothetical protein
MQLCSAVPQPSPSCRNLGPVPIAKTTEQKEVPVQSLGVLDVEDPQNSAFTSRKYPWYSFLLEAESTPGP